MLPQLDGHLLVSWRREKFGSMVLAPVGPDPASVLAGMAERASSLLGIARTIWGLVEPLVGELRLIGMSPAPLRDEWDYVYRTADLIKLEGPKYHTQRKERKKATSQSFSQGSPPIH